MPEGKDTKGRGRRPDPSTIDWDDPAEFVNLDLRSVLGVLAKEQKSGRFPELMAELERGARLDPGLVMRVPAQLLPLFASCTSTTDTAAVTVSPCDVSAMAGRVVVAFNWTDASTATSGCKVADFTSLTLTETTTGTTVAWAAIEELQKTAAAGGSPAAWFGKTKSGTPASTFAVGAAVTVTLTFSVKSTKWCHTCTPSPLTATVNTTIK